MQRSNPNSKITYKRISHAGELSSSSNMTDRRPSLIDQMALAAALEADLNFTSDEDGDSVDDDDLLLGDDDMGDPSDQRARMVFNSDVIQEFGDSED